MENSKILLQELQKYADCIKNENCKFEINTFLDRTPFHSNFSWDERQKCYIAQENNFSDKNIKIFIYMVGEKNDCIFFTSQYYIVKRTFAVTKRIIQKSFTLFANERKISATNFDFFEGKLKTKETKFFENGDLVSIEKFKDNPRKNHEIVSKISKRGNFFYGTKIATSKIDNSKLVTRYNGLIPEGKDLSFELLDQKTISAGRKKN